MTLDWNSTSDRNGGICCNKLVIAFWSKDGYEDDEMIVSGTLDPDTNKRVYMVYDKNMQDTFPMGDECMFCGARVE